MYAVEQCTRVALCFFLRRGSVVESPVKLDDEVLLGEEDIAVSGADWVLFAVGNAEFVQRLHYFRIKLVRHRLLALSGQCVGGQNLLLVALDQMLSRCVDWMRPQVVRQLKQS